MKQSVKLGIIALSIGLLVGCGQQTANQPQTNSDGTTTVKVGVCGANNDQWYAVQKVLDDQGANIKIELVNFDAYNLPNEALNAGDIDLNAFQHKAYLQSEIESQGYKIEAIGDTIIAPLTLYTKKYSSLQELQEVNRNEIVQIAVPDDATNLARALKLLEKAELIELDPAAGYSPEIKDIVSEGTLEVRPQKADTLPQTLEDVHAATINGTYAIPAGLVPSKDGLIIEDQGTSGDNPYVNIIAARSADKDNPIYKTIVEAYQSQYVADYIVIKYQDAYFPVFAYDEAKARSEGEEVVKEVDAYKGSLGN